MNSHNYEALRKAFNWRNNTEYSIDEIALYQAIVEGPAYKDFSPRTNSGLKKEKISDALKYLAGKFHEYIIKDPIRANQDEFDDWDEETCNEFLKLFNTSSGIKPIQYGKAQKIVNMTFKYLYCCDGAERYIDKFKYCHMPLDSYTLDWYSSEVLPWYNKKNESISGWSSLGKEKYTEIQEQIRRYLKDANHSYKDENGKSLTPFEVEFYIWPEQKWRRAIKTVLHLEILTEDYPQYANAAVLKECRELKEKLERAIRRFE